MKPKLTAITAISLALVFALSGCGMFTKKLDESEQRLLVFGAVLAEKNSMGYDQVFDRDQKFLDMCVESLASSWNITDAATAKSALDALAKAERPVSDEVYNADELLEVARDQNALDEAQRESLKTILVSYDSCVAELLNRGIPQDDINAVTTTRAWDWDRLVTLARWCDAAGYLTDDEMWAYARLAEQSAKENYGNWNQYFAAIELGRALSTGAGFTDAAVAERLLQSPESPYELYAFGG